MLFELQKFKVVFAAVIFSLLAFNATDVEAQNNRNTYSQLKRSSGEYITFKINRNNIPGQSVNILFVGECTYYTEGEEPITMENTFSFGGEDFPDLLVPRNGRLLVDIPEAQSDTGHVGTLSMNCRFSGLEVQNGRRTYERINCIMQFDSPVRGDEQLDDCIGGTTFSRIVRAR